MPFPLKKNKTTARESTSRLYITDNAVDNVLADAQTALGMLETVCGCVPVPAIAPIAGVLCSLLKIAEDARNNSADFLDLVETAQTVVRSINNGCKRICQAGEDISKDLEKCIQELFITLLQVEATCELQHSRPWYRKALESSTDRRLSQKLKHQMTEAQANFQSQMIILIGQGVEDIREAMDSGGAFTASPVTDQKVAVVVKAITVDQDAEAENVGNVNTTTTHRCPTPSVPNIKISPFNRNVVVEMQGIQIGRNAKIKNIGNVTTTTNYTFQDSTSLHSPASIGRQHPTNFGASEVDEIVKTVLTATTPMIKQLPYHPNHVPDNFSWRHIRAVS